MGRLAQAAHQQAAAEYNPQRQSVRRETRAQVHSLRSEEPALIAAINLARHQLRYSGLSGRDLAIAETELAHRTLDVASSTALQIGQARQEAGSKLVDLSQSQSQAERSALAALQQEALKHRQGIADEQRSNVEDFRLGLLKKEAEQKLGLTGEGTNSSGLTPTQQRAHNQSRHTAAFYAKQYFLASKGGVKDEKTGEVVIPPEPHTWSDQIWNSLAEKVASKKGVSSVTDAQHAVQAIRDHVQGQGNMLNALQTVAQAAAPGIAAIAPKPLQPVAQFGIPLLTRRR